MTNVRIIIVPFSGIGPEKYDRNVTCQELVTLDPVVQKVDRAIHWINHYPVGNTMEFVHWIVVYPVDSAIHPWNNQGLNMCCFKIGTL